MKKSIMQQRRRLLKVFAAAAPSLWFGPLSAQISPDAAGLGTDTKEVKIIRVAAASDMQFVLKEIATRFERETGHRLVLQFGSSGNLSRQIRQGLAVDVFLSADESYVLQLAEAGLTRDRGSYYGKGRVVLVVPRASALVLDERLEGVRAQIGAVQRFAIANPEHAPYGRAAREALQGLGLWDLLRPRLVLGENVSQATQFVAGGAAQAGITALSMVRAPEVDAVTRHQLLPESLHAPLLQRLVVLKQARAEAPRFAKFLGRADVRELLRRNGFADAP